MGFDVRAQQWSELVSFSAPGYFVNWVHTPDYNSVEYTTGGADPKLFRVRLADRKISTITSLKDLHRATGPARSTEISVAPDGSADGALLVPIEQTIGWGDSTPGAVADLDGDGRLDLVTENYSPILCPSC